MATIAIILVAIGSIFLGIRLYVTNAPYRENEKVKDTVDVPLDSTINVPPPLPEITPPPPAPTPVPMAQYSIAYEIVKGHEAGYQAIAQDKGNYNSLGQLVGTNWGLSAKMYERWLGRPPSKQEMKDVPRSLAERIFKEWFWDRIQGDNIPDQQLANIFFDGVVNHGYGVWLMQDVLGVPRDNRYGPITHEALLAENPRDLFYRYKNRRIRYYHSLVANDASQQVFLKGWLRRINSFDYVDGTLNGGGLAALGIGLALFWALKA